jgi:chemotaxis protein MotB
MPLKSFLWIAAIIACLTGACIPKNQYLEIEAALEDTRRQLEIRSHTLRGIESELAHSETRRQRCLTELADLNRQRSNLQNRLDSLEKEQNRLNDDIRELEFEVRKKQSMIHLQEEVINNIDATRRDIEHRMKDQIEAQEITIEQMAGKLKVTFIDKILFNTGSAAINPRGRDLLTEVAASLLENQSHEIVVQGHTDNVAIGASLIAKFPTNWELSTARATAVVRFLQEQAGLPPETLAACGYSYYRPVAPNETPEERQHNRRIEILLVPLK